MSPAREPAAPAPGYSFAAAPTGGIWFSKWGAFGASRVFYPASFEPREILLIEGVHAQCP